VSQQLLLRLPDEIAGRLRRAVPARQRSKYIADLLAQALPPDTVGDADPLYRAALAVEEDEALAAEMAEWEDATSGDGLPPAEPQR
jgi:hypothetical protein